MKLYISIFFAFILILGFSNQNDPHPHSNYIPNGKGIIRFHILNCNDTISYEYGYNTQFPFGQHQTNFTVYSDSLLEMEIMAPLPTIIYFSDYKTDANFMVLPNDTLDIFIDSKKEGLLTQKVTYKGSTEKISEYLTLVKLIYWDNIPLKDELPEDYNLRIDSLTLLALHKLNNFNIKVKLPDWFIEYEKMEIFFCYESFKLDQYSIRIWKYNQFIENKPILTPFGKKTEIKINWLTERTLDYLSSIASDKYDTLLSPKHTTSDIFFQYSRDNINSVKDRLSDKILSYFISSKISGILRDQSFFKYNKSEFIDFCKNVDSLLIDMTPLIKDTSLLKFINNYKIEQYKKYLDQKKLKQGEKAPGFYLENINGAKVSLSDFKGKMICLNFWGTHCAPCIKSIPQKNELVQKYNANDFALINICLDNNFDLWKDIIAKKSKNIESFWKC